MSRIRPHHSKIAPCTHPVLPRHWFGICFRASVRAPEKRFLVSGGFFSWKEADAYPATCLADRLPVPTLDSDAPGPDTDLPSTGTISNSTINAVRARDTLGLTAYIRWKDTVNATRLIALSCRRWRRLGCTRRAWVPWLSCYVVHLR